MIMLIQRSKSHLLEGGWHYIKVVLPIRKNVPMCVTSSYWQSYDLHMFN
jgi:hypothetical protein